MVDVAAHQMLTFLDAEKKCCWTCLFWVKMASKNLPTELIIWKKLLRRLLTRRALRLDAATVGGVFALEMVRHGLRSRPLMPTQLQTYLCIQSSG